AHESVHILAGGVEVMAEARRFVGDIPQVTLHPIRTNDAWCRDHGPTFLIGPADQPPALIDWEYNAWGGKYPPFDADNAVPQHIAALQNRRRFVPDIVLEGGAIDGNGCGTLLTTEQCLLHPNRNPHLTREAIEQYLRDYLGVRKCLWLRQGSLAGDDTDSHVDQLARFVSPNVVLVAAEPDPADVNFEPLHAAREELSRMSDQDGRALAIVPVTLPRPKYYQGQRLPASYLNFYIANGVVVVPQFDDPADAEAVAVLARCFPSRQVVGLPALDLVWGLGAFHCLTQQEPVWYESSDEYSEPGTAAT
ncbi:MAG: agmatine/peptidylarginine deiminase, partial [Pirellulaceae bacterium]